MKTSEIAVGDITITILTPDEGMVITDVATDTMRSTEVYLGKEDSADNYKDIPADTPLPDDETDDRTTVPV